MAINLERDVYRVAANSAEPELVLTSRGWYLLSEDFDDLGHAVGFGWHLGQQWKSPDHPRVPEALRGLSAVIEFCQGVAALTGRGVGTVNWHGPFAERNEDDPHARVCEVCQQLEDQLRTAEVT